MDVTIRSRDVLVDFQSKVSCSWNIMKGGGAKVDCA